MCNCDCEKLNERIKELEAELETAKFDAKFASERRDRADRMIENVKSALLDPNFVPTQEYTNAHVRAIFAAIRNLHKRANRD